MKYNYDANGAIFSYFVLTLITIILLPWTYKYITKQETKTCDCFRCVQKTRKKSIPWLLIMGWIGFSAVLYLATTINYQETKLWDPYQILNIAEDATDKEIKKAFKKLSLIYHPDKTKEADAETKFIEISKAYKTLTDNETRALFDEFGHPDGKQAFELGLALPSWLVEGHNSFFVLLAYGMAFGIGLPYIVGSWWRGARVRTIELFLNPSHLITNHPTKHILILGKR